MGTWLRSTRNKRGHFREYGVYHTMVFSPVMLLIMGFTNLFRDFQSECLSVENLSVSHNAVSIESGWVNDYPYSTSGYSPLA